jgi:preprotein translocase subunit YajC
VNGLEGILPFVLIAAVFWLLLIRPQRKRQLELLRTQRSVQRGDEVLLGAGIVGRVADADDDYVGLEVSPGVRLQVARGAVVRILVPADRPEDTEGDGDDVGPGPAGDGRAD